MEQFFTTFFPVSMSVSETPSLGIWVHDAAKTSATAPSSADVQLKSTTRTQQVIFLLHLVVGCLSCYSSSPCSRSWTELRQPPPAQHQQVNQRSQPHQHRHGHRQPPTESLHFPVRRNRRRPQPGCCQKSISQKREKKWKKRTRSQPPLTDTAAACLVQLTVKHRLHARPHSRSFNSQKRERFSDTPDSRKRVRWCARACYCIRVCVSLRESWTLLKVWLGEHGAPPGDIRNYSTKEEPETK